MAEIQQEKITSVKDHYDNHLGHFYSWMTGDFQTKSNEFRKFLEENSILPLLNKTAVDLGAGHGLQSIPLAETGFRVIAVDLSQFLLNELQENAKGLNIVTVNDDIKNVSEFADKPELIICCGDTLSHLAGKSEIQKFIHDIANSLVENGKVILSFRDYSTELKGTDRFIPVKSDKDRILTCILDYEDEFVIVTDLLHEKINEVWIQKVSAYKKVRLITKEIAGYLESNNLKIIFNKPVNRLETIIAVKE